MQVSLKEMREPYDVAIQTIFTSQDSNIKQYLFYVHVLTQCRVTFDSTLKFVAAVSFSGFKYNLHINPYLFGQMNVQHRIGVLKHEMLHIIDLHLTERRKDYDNHNWNLATDCAINQLINSDHLPDGCITTSNLFKEGTVVVQLKMTAEYYYNLIKDNEDNLNPTFAKTTGAAFDELMDCDCDSSNDVVKEITREIIKSAIESTKNCGVIPNEVQSILELKYKREINWRKELQKIIGKLTSEKKKTIMKPNRRNPGRKDLYGNKRDVKNEILVITDESGSVSDKDEAKALSEIISLCQMFKIEVDLIRVDTEPSDIIKLNKNSIKYSRIKSGGTYLSSAIEKIKKDYDVIIVLTDGELQNKDIKNFEFINKEIIWLIINKSDVSESFNTKRMRKIHIKNFKG